MSIEAEFPALQTDRAFLSNLILLLELYVLFLKNSFFSEKTEKNEILEALIFFRFQKLKKTFCNFVEHKILLLVIPISVL